MRTTLEDLETVIAFCESQAGDPTATELATSSYWRVAELARAERAALLADIDDLGPADPVTD